MGLISLKVTHLNPSVKVLSSFLFFDSFFSTPPGIQGSTCGVFSSLLFIVGYVGGRASLFVVNSQSIGPFTPQRCRWRHKLRLMWIHCLKIYVFAGIHYLYLRQPDVVTGTLRMLLFVVSGRGAFTPLWDSLGSASAYRTALNHHFESALCR